MKIRDRKLNWPRPDPGSFSPGRGYQQRSASRGWAVIGIDPGKTGAAALLPAEGELLVEEWPGDPVAAAEIMRDWSIEHDIQLVALESVHAMPKQGVSSTFTFGQNLGQWQGIISALGLPCLLPRPAEWQKGMIKKADGSDTKTRSLTAARRLFPEAELSRKKDHGRADALLLAWWAKRQSSLQQCCKKS